MMSLLTWVLIASGLLLFFIWRKRQSQLGKIALNKVKQELGDEKYTKSGQKLVTVFAMRVRGEPLSDFLDSGGPRWLYDKVSPIRTNPDYGIGSFEIVAFNESTNHEVKIIRTKSERELFRVACAFSDVGGPVAGYEICTYDPPNYERMPYT